MHYNGWVYRSKNRIIAKLAYQDAKRGSVRDMEKKLMSKSEFRKSKEYSDMVDRIKGYPIGFKFSLKYGIIPKKKGNALRVITKDCIDMGILESISIGLDIQGNLVEEEYQRIGK